MLMVLSFSLGDLILDGTSTLTLFTSTLQILTEIFEQHLLPRNQNHGFIALSSHPAETSAILQAQFLFDVLQKTLSLKLIHVPDYALQAAVKISPFKSLRHLELKCVPLHCLQGLRFIYSQLEALTCSKCVSSLKEIFSECGGDLSSALPWLELQTVNFSYNSIANLDDSLQLLNVLKALDISHNLIKDCERYLTVLTELEYLNVAYNFLTKMPDLGLYSQAKLVTLILRYNQLDNINGVEQLPSLQHLDIAYNLLLEHSLLAPLSLLHNLRRLHLEGNPLWFHQNHRLATIMHLSSRAIPCSVSICKSLSGSTYCLSFFQGKIKVRKASISEPSDTEHENRVLPLSAGVVRQHQAEMERMDSFRDRFGAHWLQYRRHLEADGQAGPATPSGSPTVESPGNTSEASEQSESLVPEKIPDTAEGKDQDLDLLQAENVVEDPKIEGDGDPEPDWIFLRVTSWHVMEVELKAARVLHRLELQSLEKVETSEILWKRMVSCGCFCGKFLGDSCVFPVESSNDAVDLLNVANSAASSNPATNNLLSMRDFFSVDHRLKLYLDMEVFDKAEEFKCFLKVAVVKNGQPGEFQALLVCSDVQLHVLEVKGEIRGQPSDWLKKGNCHCLSNLSCLEVGLCHQSLHVEFVNPSASYNLLLRNQSRCRRFLQCLTQLIQELPAKSKRNIPDVTVLEMNPQHPLVCMPLFFLGASAFPVTLLSTHSNIFLVEEDHQWQKDPPSSSSDSSTEPKDSIHLKESEPISSISGIILYRFSPCDVKLQLYDEVLKVESTWHLRTECPDLLAELVEWLRVPWEEMFSIALRKTVLEVLE
uniref:Serine/threonine-protein kinase 11-interacting protein n=1 Tax=Anolis carolinensis TaxID=28377 RepID=A0A803T4V1_ANOCA